MMKKYLVFLTLFTLLGASSALAAECSTVGRQVADEQGGELVKVTPAVEKGRDVCIVVVLVQSADGGKPSRVEVAVPAG
ncbi:MAG: Hypothetical protein BHV28_13550 [Candidatus Tokpelaia hoelldobleri]|uniref:Uncharacterized protein n=1 Tax=Candidatus Tokpelaia hoelldobleri TaxID=1902579 RepID=A0A1U9JW07_9HYPH|nr:MAG: Hypothetical protein BHV28_13550 [Candidatus Tokpelaia hoelldoblerii]